MTSPNDPRLADLLTRLSLEEKVRLLTGRDFWTTWPIESIGLRRMLLSDGPSGVRGEFWDERDPSLNLPSATALAASWDRDIAARYGRAAAVEARRKGVDVVLGPTINLHRSPLGGRHFEAFSEDPVLTADLAAAYVRGVQESGVAATPKHYIANDFETERFTVDVEVSDRALRELYLLAFEKSVVEAGAWAIMSSYNSVNGATATENPLLETPLNDEWGFDGVVVSDWTAVRSVQSAGHSQDLVMPGPDGPWGAALVAAVHAGEIAESAIDRKVVRVLTLAARVGALEGFEPSGRLPASPEDGVSFARAAASAGSVLVVNDGILPLDPAVKRIAVIGHNATLARTMGGGSATVIPERVVSPLEGITAAFPDAEISYSVGAVVQDGVSGLPLEEISNPVTGEPGVRARFIAADGGELFAEDRRAADLVWIGSGAPVAESDVLELSTRWTPQTTGSLLFGYASVGHTVIRIDGEVFIDNLAVAPANDLGASFLAPETTSAPLDVVAGVPLDIVIEHRKPQDSTFLSTLSFTFGVDGSDGDTETLIREAVAAAEAADVVVLVVGTNSAVESEGFDRSSLALPGSQDDLAARVLTANPRSVVVVNSGSPVTMPWREDAAAILLAWFGGQEFGHALGDLLSGASEPGGRLPTTWPGAQDDVPVIDVAPVDGTVRYDEGIHIGYRAWLRAGVDPAFAFGAGLGYTSWAFETADAPAEVTPGGAFTVSTTLRNSGSRTGKQVVQVYASRPESGIDRPVRWLVGFAAVTADAGETVTVDVTVAARSLAHWDDGWQYEPGGFTISVGSSVEELPLSVVVSLTA
jgi:beta-glucosidase